MTNNYVYAVARIRVREKTLLTDADISQMAGMASADAVLDYLISRGWGSAESGRDPDAILQAEETKNMALMEELGVDKKVFDIFDIPRRYHNVKAAIKEVLTSDTHDRIFYDIPDFGRREVLAIFSEKHFDALPEAMRAPAEQAFEYMVSTRDGQMCDTILDRACLVAMTDAAKKAASPVIQDYIRSTVATYANVHDELRKIYARTKSAKQYGYKAGDFSYNTGSLRCPVCDGTGQIALDVQFLPDVNIPCPECRGSRYASEAKKICYKNKTGEERSLPELMDMDVNTALGFCRDMKTVRPRLEILRDLGLGYLTLGEETPGLSGGEAQRLKLASEMGRQQEDSVFVFDEPTIGLHPKDVETLLNVFQTLIDHGATVIVIEHDLDVIRSADYIIDMGPGGGEDGGRIIACGTPDEIRCCSESITGRFI